MRTGHVRKQSREAQGEAQGEAQHKKQHNGKHKEKRKKKHKEKHKENETEYVRDALHAKGHPVFVDELFCLDNHFRPAVGQRKNGRRLLGVLDEESNLKQVVKPCT